MKLSLDGTQRNTIVITAFGVGLPIYLEGTLTDATLNGQSFVLHPINVSLATTNTLIVTCR